MKKLMVMIMLLFASPVAAQLSHAYDPNYVDFSARMDTLASIQVSNFNSGLLNADPFEDFYLVTDVDNPSRLRYGGPFIFDSTIRYAPFDWPYLRADLDGDGIPDIMGVGGNLSNGPSFFKGIRNYPYFDTATALLTDRYHRAYAEAPNIIGAADVNGDGITDIVADDGGSGVLVIFSYYGSPHFGDSTFITANDSSTILPDLSWTGGTIGSYSKGSKPLLFLAGNATSPDTPHTVTYKIGVLRHLNDLAHDSMVYLSQTTDQPKWYNPTPDSMIAATGLYTMDITGDGIPDLLVTDNKYIYIFKGSDSLGYYPLTKDRAYYQIPHPVLLEGPGSDWSYIDQWADRMFNCGDLTGTGIPVLGVDGQSQFTGRNAIFFYSGGKALDSLFDGVVRIKSEGYGSLDTLHSINILGRSAVLLPDYVDYNAVSYDFLLYRDGENIPHQTNPRFASVNSGAIPSELNLSAVPSIANRYVKIHIASPEYVSTELTIFNLLGEIVAARTVAIDPGDNIEYFDISHWPSGTYIAELSVEEQSFNHTIYRATLKTYSFTTMKTRPITLSFLMVPSHYLSGTGADTGHTDVPRNP